MEVSDWGPVLKGHKSQEPEPNLHSCLTRKPRLKEPSLLLPGLTGAILHLGPRATRTAHLLGAWKPSALLLVCSPEPG